VPVVLAHSVNLGIGRGALQFVHGADAKRRVAAKKGGVRRGGVGVDSAEEIRHAGEFIAVSEEIERRRRALTDEAERGQADAAVSGDDGGDALARLIGHVRFGEQSVIVMRMDVDEAGCDDPITGVMLYICGGLRKVTDRGDAFAPDADIGKLLGRSGTVDDVTVSDDHVVFVRHSMSLMIFSGHVSI